MTRRNEKGTLRTIIRLGLLRGVFRGSKVWLYLGVTAFVLRLFGRLTARKPVVVTDRLRPGERMLITHFKRNQA